MDKKLKEKSKRINKQNNEELKMHKKLSRIIESKKIGTSNKRIDVTSRDRDLFI